MRDYESKLICFPLHVQIFQYMCKSMRSAFLERSNIGRADPLTLIHLSNMFQIPAVSHTLTNPARSEDPSQTHQGCHLDVFNLAGRAHTNTHTHTYVC